MEIRGGLYESLNPLGTEGFTRVLDLQPSVRLDGQLKGTLRVASIDETEKYEALSYTWGQSSENRTIQLNGCTLRITDNLYNALRRLRRLTSTRTLWVDALCINQDDLHERSQQVAIMGEIYGKAARVLVWLGEYSKASRLDLWQ